MRSSSRQAYTDCSSCRLLLRSYPPALILRQARFPPARVVCLLRKMDGNIDCDALISAIKSQELIWNYKLDDHSDRIEKNNAWAAISEQLIENFNEKPVADKNKIAMSLQKKWKVLRGGFSRYAKKIKPKSGSAATKIRPYPYYEQLLFLKVIEARPEKSDSLKETCEESDHKKVSAKKNCTLKRKLNHKTEDDLIEKLSKRIDEKPSSKLPVEDDDKMFLLSLAGEFKNIKDQYKLDAKSEIINVIKYFKGISQHTQSSYYGESRGYFAPSTNEHRGHNYSMSNVEQRGYNYSSYNKGYQSAPSTSDQLSPLVSANDEFSQSSFEDSHPPSSVRSDYIISDIFND
ncbi:uncharacterized protein LOC119190952 [Manduca sexta]|uniref:uncharacterized protein LOC119190952 n=1 Tax=Manduca sexta TaxID=7130 RepID=UPI00188E41D7|nr:uncharacterized protein LOC119190952 [Manduca sexta]XP_037300419.1 uncharacterized protein LOC119190952 [Manduca sexta]